MNYVTNTFLLVRSSVRSKQLLGFVQGQAKNQNKNIQQRTFTSFITILLLACVAGGVSRASAFVLVAKPWTRGATPWEDWWRVKLKFHSRLRHSQIPSAGAHPLTNPASFAGYSPLLTILKVRKTVQQWLQWLRESSCGSRFVFACCYICTCHIYYVLLVSFFKGYQEMKIHF